MNDHEKHMTNMAAFS